MDYIEFQNSLKPGDILYIKDYYKKSIIGTYCYGSNVRFILNAEQLNYYYNFVEFKECDSIRIMSCHNCKGKYVLHNNLSFKIIICGIINDITFFKKIVFEEFIKEEEMKI